MPKKTAKKKPNPQDATLRNIRALKKRVAELEETNEAHEALIATFNQRIETLAEVVDTVIKGVRAITKKQ